MRFESENPIFESYNVMYSIIVIIAQIFEFHKEERELVGTWITHHNILNIKYCVPQINIRLTWLYDANHKICRMRRFTGITIIY